MSPLVRKRAATAILVGLAVLYLVGLAWLSRAGQRVELCKVDCILVPGARALPGGPGPSLQARVDHAVQLWKAGWAPNLLMTGGLGDDYRFEALTARSEAERQGVPAARIALEAASHTTWENFYYANREMQRRGWKTCLVCTDPYHEPRCLLIAHELGIEAHPAPTFTGPASTRTGSWLYYNTRECLALLKWGLQRELGRPG